MNKKFSLLIFTITMSFHCAHGQQALYDVSIGNGNGIRFWQSDDYKIHMGYGAEYQYGPVTDYSIKSNMYDHAGRGWTWGVVGQTPIAALSTQGHFKMAGTLLAMGDLGIGTDAPFNAGGWHRMIEVRGPSHSKILSTTGNATIRTGLFAHSTWYGGGGMVGTESNHKLHLITNEDVKMTVDVNGNVGIGIQSPSAKLQVVGPGTGSGVTLNVAGGGDVLLNSGGSVFFDGNYSYGSGNYIRPFAANTQGFFTAGTERMRITPEGNIGMGVIPYSHSKLHVKAPTQSPWGFVVEASVNKRIVGVGHDGTTGYVSTSALDAVGHSPLALRTSNVNRIFISVDGQVGIGTSSPTMPLTVNGTIYGKEVKVDLNVPGPDYVFDRDYRLLSLQEVENYINKHKHLPEVPSAETLKETGIELGEMNMLLLKKVEELTLYLIELKKEVEALKQENDKLRK